MRKFLKHVLFLLLITAAELCGQSNPLHADSPLPGIIEYQQTLKVRCANAEEAKNLTLSQLKLPEGAEIAFSARWDDSNIKHFKTQEVMLKNGIKGTFYLNARGHKNYSEEYCKKLLKGGCSIGAHTKTHPMLPGLNPNEQFYEIMSARVIRESDSDSPVSTMVLPYCQYKKSEDPQIQLDIGKAMMNSGYIGAPEPSYGSYEITTGYPQGTLAESALIRPGDSDADEAKAREQVKKYLAMKDKMSLNPSMSLGIHSWHTEKGLQALDNICKELSGNKNWWYCNQNEYAAYRFEANNCKITKSVSGDEVTFTITRFTPESLGANVDLWFKLTGTKTAPAVIEPSTAKIISGNLQLPHSTDKSLPQIIALAGTDGKSAKIPSVEFLFTVKDTTKPTLTIRNNSQDDLSDTIITIRSGAGFTPGVIVETTGTIGKGKELSKEWELKANPDTRYTMGRPYYVAQLDCTKGGKRYRLYSDFRQKEANKPIALAQNFITAYLKEDKTDYAKLSLPESPINGTKLIKAKIRDSEILSKDAINFLVPKKDFELAKDKTKVAVILDFSADIDGDITLNTKADEVFINGQSSKGSNKYSWKLPVTKKANRLVLIYPVTRANNWVTKFLFTSGGKFSEFHPVK